MKRFELEASEGYNPCPSKVIEVIQSLVGRSSSGGTLLDNCAGDGLNAVHLAAYWGLQAYLVEVHPERGQLCQSRCGVRALVGSAEAVDMEGVASVWFFNPPFDPDDPTGAFEHRLFTQTSGYAVGEGTIGLLLFPVRVFQDALFTAEILRHFDDVRIRLFPEPEYTRFGQAVVFGVGRSAHRNDVTNEVVEVMQSFRGRGLAAQELRAHEFLYQLCEVPKQIQRFVLR